MGNADDIPVDIRTVVQQYSSLFPTGLDHSLFEDLLYPELWFVNSLTLKSARDAVYQVIAKANSLTYDTNSEGFYTSRTLVMDGSWFYE